MKIRVVLADNHVLVRQGIKSFLSAKASGRREAEMEWNSSGSHKIAT